MIYLYEFSEKDIINFSFTLESELSTNDYSMTENLSITDETFYDAKTRCGNDHVMLM